MHPSFRQLLYIIFGMCMSLAASSQPGVNSFQVENRMHNSSAAFHIPDTVCLGNPVTITNQSQNASSYFWDFCVADIRQAPVGLNMGNGNNNLRMPVFMDYVYENGNYYGFMVNFFNPGLTRLDFGNSLLNTPAYSYLGTMNVIPPGAEGIQVVKNEGKWYAIIVGGNPVFGSTSTILKIEFGTNIANNTPTGTNWGNIGNLFQPLDLHLFKDGNNWHGFTVNGENNSFTRFDFTSSFDNTPTGVNFGSVGGLQYPTGIHAVNDAGQWRVFVVNGGNDSRTNGNWSLSRLDFGNSLLNTPTGVNLGNTGGFLKHPRDLTITISCGQIVGYAVNGAVGSNDIVMFDFNGSLTNVPSFSSLGNRGNLSFPHSISKLFREGSDLYAFVTNVDNNTFTRLRFQGCDVANFPPSTLQNPPPITYSAVGTYGINLTTDIGLATQDAECKSVVVVPPLQHRPTPVLEFCGNASIRLGAQTSAGSHVWNTGATGDSIEVNSPGIYWVETSYYGCVNRDSFEIRSLPVPQVNLGADLIICGNSTATLDASAAGIQSYLWNTGATTSSINVTQAGEYSVMVNNGTCAAYDTILVDFRDLNVDFLYKQDVCDPLSVDFSLIGDAVPNVSWNFGAGNNFVSGNSQRFTYAAQGDYTVKMAVQNGSCRDTIEKNISVRIYPTDIIITPDTTVCAGGSALLRAMPSLSFCWTPADYLDNVLLANPTSTPLNPIQYYFTAERLGANLISNGDFSQGNVGFVSDYTQNATSGVPEGVYAVLQNPSAWHPSFMNCADHTTAGVAGNMMMVNGTGSANAVIWSQTVQISPNTNYAFSAWVQSLVALNPARLQFTINGRLIGPILQASNMTCEWNEFYATWNSGNLTSAEIAIVNKNTNIAGNDFAIDDIVFAPVFIQRDSVNIDINLPVVDAPTVATVCSGSPVQLSSSGAVSYSWSNAAFLNNSTLQNPIAIVVDTTRFIVTGTNSFGCSASDTVWVNVFPKPAVQTSADTSICKNSSLQIWANGANSYIWDADATLQNGNSSNPIVTPSSNTRYFVTATDIFNCNWRDSVTVNILPDPTFGINPNVSICTDDSVQLLATGGDIYSWTPTTGMNISTIANPMVSPAVTSQYEVTITEQLCGSSAVLSTTVEVLPVPSVSASRTNDIDCTNDQTTLIATGAATYSWTPGSTLNNSSLARPIARPRQTTTYHLEGISAEGCKGYDSVLVKVEAVNEGMYLMPTAFTPNADGLNDCYGIRYWGVVEKVEFSVYNRWGERIFYSTDPNACWDGRYKGTPQDAGVFVYMIKAKTFCSEEVFRKGTFTLIR